jgi:copper(I)-binding protein
VVNAQIIATLPAEGDLLVLKYFVFASCLYLACAAAAAAQTSLEIVSPWARASVGQPDSGAVYLTIVSRVSDRLTAAASPAAKVVELHMMSMEGEMRPIDTIEVLAGWPVSLTPGGLHLMLVGLAQPLREGRSFALTLFFDKAGRREITVAVEEPSAMSRGGNSPAPTADPVHHH